MLLQYMLVSFVLDPSYDRQAEHRNTDSNQRNRHVRSSSRLSESRFHRSGKGFLKAVLLCRRVCITSQGCTTSRVRTPATNTDYCCRIATLLTPLHSKYRRPSCAATLFRTTPPRMGSPLKRTASD